MRSPHRSLFPVFLLSAVPLAAQISLPSPAPITVPQVFQQTVTTAIVGFAASQTVQLNVLNSGIATTTTVAGCEVQLAFYDSQNRLLKQGTATNVAPGNATSLSLVRGDVPTASATTPRVSLRGHVTVVPPTSATAGPAVLVSSCSLFTSLEVYDTVTGVTQVFTADTQSSFTGEAVPLTIGQPAGR